MKRTAWAIAFGALTTASVLAQSSPDDRFRGMIQAQNIRASMQKLSARPRHVGSPYNKEGAEWMLAQFRSWGWDAQIEQFDVLFPTPKERVLEMTAPARFVAKLDEPVVSVDPTTGQKMEQLPSYNAYSIDGDVTAPLVYVNYGRVEDYDQLERMGVSARGAIVIVRYGGIFRGVKVKIASEHGAVGCLIYSDPKDDGYFGGDVFPKGPMRPSDGVQRGSVEDLATAAGDPLTPNIGAVPGAPRIDRRDSNIITKIPVLPISYGDAQPLLAALGGLMAPVEWRGSLPIPYRLGTNNGRATLSGEAMVHLKVAFNWDQKPLYDVIAKIPGSTFPDEWIVRGNHHDGWVNGANDPISGMAPELEEARVLGELRKQGWNPKRTIIYASWDGEEPGLLGSTEWVEQHEKDLRAHAVAYINSDGNGRGFVGLQGTHTLERFLNGVANDVSDPETGMSVLKRKRAAVIARGTPDDRKDARDRIDFRISPLGSGSDYTPFLQHAGIASINIGYGDEDDDGIYHSIYDDFYFYTHFLDTDFAYGRALAQTIGTAVIRLADADVVPIEFTDFADTMQKYDKELKDLLSKKQDDIRERNRQIADGVFAAIRDPKKPVPIPKAEEVPPAINFAPLDNATTALTESARRYDKALTVARTKLTANHTVLVALNAKLRQAESQLTDSDGLYRRPWYRHLIYAPGYYTGYGVKTIPGVREGIEDARYADAEREVTRAAAALTRLTALIHSAASDLEKLQ
ncbi:MAG TPA: transferrin receptor-like dimerization domain-containing protein [Vicinamibacterales bacterium]|nr:transferrin receptor-like dimerization domain-containing protein [Vicinamibacterales bacterium]